MVTHHNRRLFDLATSNSQRLNLSEVFAAVTRPLQDYLAAAEKHFHPGTPVQLKNAVARSMELHSRLATLEREQLVKTSQRSVANSWLTERLHKLRGETFYVCFGGANGLTFDGAHEWVPVLPVFHFSLVELAPVWKELLSLCKDQLAIVQQGNASALILESYSGYLPDEPSAHEVVYELSFWQNDA